MSFTLHAFVWACLQIGALGGCVLVVAWLFRGSRPQWISSLLAGACIAMLIVAGIALIPTGQWTIVSQAHVEEMKQHDLAVSSSGLDEGVEIDREPSPDTIETQDSAPRKHSENSLYSVHMLVSKTLHRFDQRVRDSEPLQEPAQSNAKSGVVIALISGLVCMLLLWLSSYLYIRRVFRHSTLIEDCEMLGLVDCYAKKFALSSTPLLRESSLIATGATVGWLHPTIFLHSDWRKWSEREIAAVVAHELAHVCRRDYLWVVIATWTKIVLFFHPVVHVLVQRMRAEQELAADQLAAGKIGDARAYGRALASLALRSQPHLQASSPKLGSMLAIGQICVTRRVMMLRKGFLKPIQTRSRLCFAILLAGACTAIPFTGLRGSIQEGSNDFSATEKVVEPTTESEKSDKDKPETNEVALDQSSLSFEGSMVYRPGRLRAGEFGAEAAWIQDWFTASIIGKPIPDKAVLYGKSYVGLRWDDETRQHGRLDLSANVTEADASLPGQMQSMNNFPFSVFSRSATSRVVATRDFHGRALLGLTESPTSDSPEKWMIDDELGYFIGSLEDAERFALGQRSTLDAIPQVFRDDYTKAAFAMVYADCNQWAKRVESFISRSPRESEFKIAVPLLRDLQQLGLFVDGCKSPACTLRAVTGNAKEAEQLAKRVGGLLEVAKLAIAESKTANEDDASSEMTRSMIETMTISVTGSEVSFNFDILISSFDDQSAFAFVNRFYAGWQSPFFSYALDSAKATEKVAYVMPNDDYPKTPGLFSQTIDAKNYRGKMVEFQVDMLCDELGYANSGAFVWASRHEEVSQQIYGERKPMKSGAAYTNHKMLAARTMAMDGVSTFRAAMDAERTRVQATNDGGLQTNSSTGHLARSQTNDKESWQTVTVRVLVPEDAEHISFGCYSKNRIVKVRSAQFDEVSLKDASTAGNVLGQDAVADVPFNLLIVPGYKIEPAPINLDFGVSSRASVGVAEQPSKADSSPTKR